MTVGPGYAPEMRLLLAGRPVPATLRGSVSTVSATCGLGDADRVELNLANEGLRWLDHQLLRLDTPLELWLGYAPDAPQRVFAGEVVGTEAAFASDAMPTLTVVAQDRRTRLASAAPSRWFGVNLPHDGVMPLPDVVVAPLLAAEHGLIPQLDPLGALLSAAVAVVEDNAAMDDAMLRQQIVRHQDGVSTLELLKKIAAENAWDIAIDHAASPSGLVLTLLSPATRLAPDVTLAFGRSLIDFTPRVSTVGQVAKVSVRVWKPSIRLELTVSVGYDWDRRSLQIEVVPGFGRAEGGFGPPGEDKKASQVLLVGEPVSPANAARVVLGKLLPLLNRRTTASGSCPGNAAIRAGHVLRIEGVGETYGGLWRVTSVRQSLDGSGWRTSFEARKEIWLKEILSAAIPVPPQGEVRVQGGTLSLPLGGSAGS